MCANDRPYMSDDLGFQTCLTENHLRQCFCIGFTVGMRNENG